MMGKAFDRFKINIEKAERLKVLVDLKNSIRENVSTLVELLPPDLPFSLIPGPKNYYFKTLKPLLDDYAILTDEICYEQSLTFSVTSLEAYLKDKYSELNPADNTQYNFQRVDKINEAFGKVGKNAFPSDNLRKDIGFILQIRHAIIHSAGEIGDEFNKNCAKFDFWDNSFTDNRGDYRPGTKMNLLINKEYIEKVHKIIKQFVSNIENEFA